jgi:hypothetical protein
MRNKLVTPFWQKASRSLPAHVRERYAGHLVRAERFDLVIDSWIDLFARVKAFIARPFHTA